MNTKSRLNSHCTQACMVGWHQVHKRVPSVGHWPDWHHDHHFGAPPSFPPPARLTFVWHMLIHSSSWMTPCIMHIHDASKDKSYLLQKAASHVLNTYKAELPRTWHQMFLILYICFPSLCWWKKINIVVLPLSKTTAELSSAVIWSPHWFACYSYQWREREYVCVCLCVSEPHAHTGAA